MEVKSHVNELLLNFFLSKNLNTINYIHFTKREIDVIACAIGGRTYKNIASTLLISPKTVENHINSILIKINGRSKEDIINFIENSNQYSNIKAHYDDLIINNTFLSELKGLSYLHKEKVNCLVICHKEQVTKTTIINKLKKHFQLIGTNFTNKIWSNNIITTFLHHADFFQQIDYVIYFVTTEFIRDLRRMDYSLKEEALALACKLKHKKRSIIFILEDTMADLKVIDGLNDFTCISLNKHNNYYCFFFEILKTLFFSHNFEKNIASFNIQYNKRNSYVSSIQQSINNEENTTERYLGKQNPDKANKNITLTNILFFIFIIFGLCLFSGLGITHYFKSIHKEKITITNKESDKTTIINSPPRNNNFIGRKTELNQIKTQLAKESFGTITQAVAGIGGVGKTQLATELVYNAAHKNAYSLIFWVSAETKNTIFDSYRAIANYFQLDIAGIELDKMQSLIHNKIASIYHGSKVLFILDNVPNQESISNYLAKIHKELSPSLSSNILVTSRSQLWPGNPLILDIFTSEEALTFVQKLLPYENKAMINKLTAKLHYFPLALGQATTYIRKHTNIVDYLELYEAKQKDYLDKFQGDKNQYNESLWKTWNITLSKLSNKAKTILFISAFLDPDDIPFSFFEGLTTEEKASSIEELRNYSLITLINNKSFKIHRLLQEVIKFSVKYNAKPGNKGSSSISAFEDNNYWITKAITLLEARFDFDFLNPQQSKLWSQYLSHTQAITSNIDLSSDNTLHSMLKLYIKYAMFLLYVQHDPNNSILAWNKIKILIQQHYKNPATELIVANINTHLSNAQSWIGNHNEAIEILKKTMPVYQKTFHHSQHKEWEFVDLLRLIPFKNNTNNQIKIKCDLNFALLVLSSIQNYMGLVHEALESNIEAVKTLEKVQPNTTSQFYLVDAWGALGGLYIYLGQLEEAGEILKKAMATTDKLYSNHTRQALIYDNLALFYYHTGKFDKSINLLNKSAGIRTNLFSQQHEEHADTHIKLGFINQAIGKSILAKKEFLETQKINQIYHDDLLKVYVNLGFWKTYEGLQQYDKAKFYMDKALTIAKTKFHDNIGIMLSSQLTQAELWPNSNTIVNTSYWQEVLKVNKEMFGNNGYQAAKAHYMLGLAFENNKKSQKAFKHYCLARKILSSQNIKHLDIKNFYVKNINLLDSKIAKTGE